MTIYDTRNSAVAAHPAALVADDGRELPATRFEPAGEARGAVVIVPAMATPARFYAAFASWLAESGFHVLTFDYRGTGSVTSAAETAVAGSPATSAASASKSRILEMTGRCPMFATLPYLQRMLFATVPYMASTV